MWDQKEATSAAISIKKSPVESNILLIKPVENLIDFWYDKNSEDDTEVMKADKRNSSRGEEINSAVPRNVNLAEERTSQTRTKITGGIIFRG